MANWLGEDPPATWLNPHARTLYREPSHAAPVPPFNAADQVPASGRVHTPNSFTGMSAQTAERTEKLQRILQRTLGPEHVATRPGGGGTKLSYLEGWRAINLANDIFGYNGWYTDIKYLEADFIDFDEGTQRYSMGVTAIVRVRLQDGASHEDVGYGKLENTKSKADGLDKCKKEAVTDALKRALRHFGKLLGNCLYDKSYLEGLSKMKAPKSKFDFDGIYKPERDTLGPIASTSAAPAQSMPPPPPPAAAASAPQREPAKAPPAFPPHLAAQVQRASTVTPRAAPPAARAAPPARAAAPAPAAGSAPRRAATIATAPNPYDRTGAQTEFPLNSDDESMFAAVDFSAVESGTGAVYFEGDSGFGEMDGLADASLTTAIKPTGPPTAPTHAPQRPSPPDVNGGTDKLQASKAAAQARLAEANKRKAEAQRRVSTTGDAAAGTAAGTASAAELLKQGGARPPALRPPQAPPSRSTSLIGTAGAPGKPPPRVAGALLALAVGAGVVRAAGGAGVLEGLSPDRQHSVAGGGAGAGAGAGVEVLPQGGFVSARGVKRTVGEGYDPSPPPPHGAAPAGPRASHSPRAPLGELAVDGATGAIKRQRGPPG